MRVNLGWQEIHNLDNSLNSVLSPSHCKKSPTERESEEISLGKVEDTSKKLTLFFLITK